MKRLGLGLAMSSAVAAAGMGLLAGVGVAGWRGGWIVAVALVPAAVGAAAWFGIGDSGKANGRGLYTAAMTILALVAGVKAIDYAPESRGRLGQRLDGLPLPFFDQLSETGTGRGWCQPTCPSITRNYRGPELNALSARVQVAAALATIDLAPNLQTLLADRQNRTIDDRTDTTRVHVELSTDDQGRVLAAVTITARRGFDEGVPTVG